MRCQHFRESVTGSTGAVVAGTGSPARTRGRLWCYLTSLLLGLTTSMAVAAGPKNVIFFIGDGMGPEQVRAANYFNGGPLSFEGFPYQGSLTTYAANSSVTDSAAAATALATGHKVDNGVISQARPANSDYPVYGSEMETLLEYFQARGKSTGLVTTTYMTHATPAAFGAHEPSRNNLNGIAADYLNQTRPNVLFGGGANGLSSGTAVSAGYTVVTDQNAHAEFEYEHGNDGKRPIRPDPPALRIRWVGCVTASVRDDRQRPGHPGQRPGWILLDGGRRSDRSCRSQPQHWRNVLETVELGNTVAVAISWAALRNDTLILVAADHETGGLSVIRDNGAGNYPTVSWSTDDHTSVNVPVYAWGPHASLISGILDNTDLFEVVTIPEPSSLVLAVLALFHVLIHRKSYIQ